MQMMLEQFSRKRVERRLHGGDLRQDVDAVSIVIEHVADPAHLTFDPPQPAGEIGLAGRVARHPRMPRRWMLAGCATRRRHSLRPRLPTSAPEPTFAPDRTSPSRCANRAS